MAGGRAKTLRVAWDAHELRNMRAYTCVYVPSQGAVCVCALIRSCVSMCPHKELCVYVPS